MAKQDEHVTSTGMQVRTGGATWAQWRICAGAGGEGGVVHVERGSVVSTEAAWHGLARVTRDSPGSTLRCSVTVFFSGHSSQAKDMKWTAVLTWK